MEIKKKSLVLIQDYSAIPEMTIGSIFTMASLSKWNVQGLFLAYELTMSMFFACVPVEQSSL